MFREIIIPTEKSHSIDLPPSLYGKRIEVIAFEIDQPTIAATPKNKFLDDIEPIPNFPSLAQIRQDAWPGE